MNQSKSCFMCSYCSKIYKDPIELPCDDYICREHLKEKEVIKQNKIKCQVCKQEFEVKDNQFKSNKFAQKQISEQFYFNWTCIERN